MFDSIEHLLPLDHLDRVRLLPEEPGERAAEDRLALIARLEAVEQQVRVLEEGRLKPWTGA